MDMNETCQKPIHYSIYLRHKLEERKRRNFNYSMRSFARDLDLSPSFLSEVLNKKHSLSSFSALKIANKLKMQDEDVEYFINLVLSTEGKTQEIRKWAQKKLENMSSKIQYYFLDSEIYKKMTDWFYFAILESLNQFQNGGTVEKISTCFSIHPIRVQKSLEKLEKYGLVELKDEKYFLNLKNYNRNINQIFLAEKTSCQQLINKSANFIYTQSETDSEFSNFIVLEFNFFRYKINFPH